MNALARYSNWLSESCIIGRQQVRVCEAALNVVDCEAGCPGSVFRVDGREVEATTQGPHHLTPNSA